MLGSVFIKNRPGNTTQSGFIALACLVRSGLCVPTSVELTEKKKHLNTNTVPGLIGIEPLIFLLFCGKKVSLV